MMRMYFKSIVTKLDGGKIEEAKDIKPDGTETTSNVYPYTTGRSISDILEQVRVYIPNMQ